MAVFIPYGQQLFYETGNERDFHFQHIDRKFTALYFNSQGCQKSLKQTKV